MLQAPDGGAPFLKMHGLGNDFVVIDARAGKPRLSPEAARAIADRRRGDQPGDGRDRGAARLRRVRDGGLARQAQRSASDCSHPVRHSDVFRRNATLKPP